MLFSRKMKCAGFFVLIIVSSAIRSGAFSQSVHNSSGFSDVDAAEFYALILSNDDELIIDVRTKKEYRKSHIENAVLADTKEELEAICLNSPTDRTIMIYCEQGKRSRTACDILSKFGFTNVYNLSGGLVEWKLQKYPLQ